MADKYVFELDDGGLKIIVVDEAGPFNTWSSEPFDSCLITKGGRVNSSTEKGFICTTGLAGNNMIISLLGANWDSDVGDSGKVETGLVSGCNPKNWELIEKT